MGYRRWRRRSRIASVNKEQEKAKKGRGREDEKRAMDGHGTMVRETRSASEKPSSSSSFFF
jgi:hypothetical protein